jgi:phage baseplate assembly protein W
MTDDASLFGRGVGFPPRIGSDGRVAWSSGADNVRESIRVILTTEAGERVMRPDFGAGLRAFLFEPNVPATHQLIEETIVHSLRRWEPRVALAGARVEPDPADEQRANVSVRYTLVATGEAGGVELAVRLGGQG